MTGQELNGVACGACGTQQNVMKRCTRCKSVLYCSRECQAAHWPDHKLFCGPSAPEGQTEEQIPRPSAPRHNMHSGVRILPDGGYEAYSQGEKLGKDGFPVKKPQGPSSEGTRVQMCPRCGGQGRISTTCEGIVRTSYCEECQGEGAICLDSTGKQILDPEQEQLQRSFPQITQNGSQPRIQVVNDLD